MGTKTLEEFLPDAGISLATPTVDGLMSKEDKAKLDETEDYVIDTWIAADHLSYYKKYKSGLVVQGGYVASATTGTVTTTATFPVALTTTPAKITVRELSTNTTPLYVESKITSASATGFSFTQFANSGNPDIGYYWEAVGYLTPA